MAKTNSTAKQAANLSTVTKTTLGKLNQVQGWTVKDDTAFSPVGTQVRFTAKTVVISNSAIKNGKNKTVLKLDSNTNTAIIAQIAVIEKAAKSATVKAATPSDSKPADKPAAKQSTTDTTTDKGDTMPATATAEPTAAEKKKAAAKAAADKKKAAAKAAADKKKAEAAAAKKAAEEAKPAPTMPTNPAGEGKTPAYDEVKNAAEKEEKLESAKREMWSKVGEKYGYSVKPLTRQLMIEGVWPVGLNAKGEKATVELEDGTIEFAPMGYQRVYKEEKEKGTKGIGHFVNVAAAAFGRINMAIGKAKAEEEAAKKTDADKKADADKEESGLTTKQINKMLTDIERIANKLPEADLKTWLETSRSMAPILAAIKAEDSELDALADI